MCTHVVVVCQMHICERNLSCDSPACRYVYGDYLFAIFSPGLIILTM